ncbi:ATP-binding protein [Swaminathania salitolerans]|uniref:ATP-binding protein n=1 Tax=Swaminathania salitolerans TaxID=182838 RepID=A0A511BSA3_9PROT|nr:ATP-binding protein [Swaminathania salitolerans]GBQ12931.1 GMP reductase [Swaminathania salitolerans LMG 21291]GEL03217.1 ATP-binding protein [Swaminathania salitolerans]
MSVSIVMGRGRDGADIPLDLTELLSTRLLVQGNSGSGKSHLLRRLLEQTATLVQQVIVDPEGDFVTLAEKYGHLVIDAAEQTEATLRAAGERARMHRASVVLNLESVEAEMQLRAAGSFLNGMFEAPRTFWYPVLVVVDEAQLFAPVAGGDTSDEARRLSLGAMTNLMCRGRKRGLAGVIATQRLAKLAKNVAAEASNFLMGRTFLDIDMLRAADLLGMERRTAEGFRDLARGQFMALGPALSRRPLMVTIGEVETASHAGGPVLTPFEARPAEDSYSLILEPVVEPPPRPRERRAAAPDLLAQLDAYNATIPVEEPETPCEADPERLWSLVEAVVSETDSAYRPLATLYQDFQLRARIEKLSRDVLDLAAFRILLASVRSGTGYAQSVEPDWQQALDVARSLPEDVQGVVLLLARAALDHAPCPDDDAIAQAYGTHSLGRARRQLAYLEERQVIVVQEMASTRRIAFIGLGWQTA